jgi:peptidoglycan hydrolase-like protein with peptidoglycan-binding domain
METFAFIQTAVAYEAPTPELRALDDFTIPSSAWVGLAGVALAASILTQSPNAEAAVRRGNSGASVRAVQQALVNLGYLKGPVDGVFGPQTEDAVLRMQARTKVPVDGIVGPRTASALGLGNPDSYGSGGGGGGTPGGGTPGRGTVTVTASSGLRIRSGPGMGYGVVGGLDNGDTVSVVSSANGWYQLSRGGWISGSYTTAGGGGGGGGTPSRGTVTVSAGIG